MKSGIVIQARMGSTRLPGKVLRKVGGATLLELCATRAARARTAGVVVIATTDRREDDAIAAEAERLGFPSIRGSEDDVLSRYHLAASLHGLDVVCRVTSDCPLIDPEVIDRVFDVFVERGCDYASNVLRRTYPRGLDTEIFSFAALDRAHREGRRERDREHVTPYLFENPSLFHVDGVELEEDLSFHRWTVDEPDDYEFVKAVLERLDESSWRRAGFRDILAVITPELMGLNEHVRQKAG